MNPFYAQIAERALHQCEYCRAPEAVFNFPFEVEHVVPSGLGGTNEESNLALSCRACNIYKGDVVQARDPETNASVPLFHPRHDHWEKHFRVDATNATINGLTPIGRATVERLRMNRPIQTAARREWMRLQLFPSR